MKAADLREKNVDDLRELGKSLARDVFQNRLKNFTNRLDDTSAMRKARRDLARVATLLRERELGLVRKRAEAPAAAEEPKAAQPAEAAATKKRSSRTARAPKKAKKSEAEKS
jgi:large subunit ribosomal protein L29